MSLITIFFKSYTNIKVETTTYMETTPTLIESIFERVEDLGKTTYELSKLKALETTSVVVTALISRLIVFMVFTIFLVVLSIGIALILGEWLHKSYYGFLIVAAFYLIAGIVLHFFLPKWIKNPIINLIIPPIS